MMTAAPNSQGTRDSQAAYAHSSEHLADELRRLDWLIRLRVLQQQNGADAQRPTPASPLNQFKGLVLSEEEIAGLLADAVSPLGERKLTVCATAENQTLVEAVSRLTFQIQERRAASLQQGVYLSLPHLAQIFRLTPFEEQCLLICLAPELDRKYEKLYAYLQDDVTRKKPSVDLALNLLCLTAQDRLAARAAFEAQAPLLRYRLLQMTDGSPDGASPLLSRFLKLDDRIVNFLLCFGQMDARLEPMVRLIYPQVGWDEVVAPEEVKSRMQPFVRSLMTENGSLRQNVVFYFHGPYGSEKRSLAEAVCRDLGIPLLIGDVEAMLGGAMQSIATPFEETVWLLGREAVLQPAALCLENADCLFAEDGQRRSQLKSLLKAARTFSRLTFLMGSDPWKPQGLWEDDLFIALEFPVPDDAVRKRLWEGRLNGQEGRVSDVDVGALASQFRFTPGQIHDALCAAQNRARWRSPDAGQVTREDLYVACRAQSNPKLGALARKIEPKYTWDDIVLPPDPITQLREICAQARYRHVVYGEWGFDRKLSLGKGLSALFSGPPGTGKTMAAEVIANELRLDLYKIDLSQVVSKYIGETEKNLHQIFREAQTSNAILFFDEADALFGKRSEVKDAHDRYANIEIAYLLQKMDEYDGITILATNLRQNVDEAFVRRMHVIVEFPFPDEEHRRRIWEVVFPRETPLADDVDFDALAREVKLAGGNIKNIALAAAFYAAEEGGRIQMAHLLRATRREFQKMGRVYEGERT